MHFPINNRICNRVIAVTFVAALWLPLIGLYAGWGRFNDREENRLLTVFPERPRNLRDCASYPWRFAAYFHDHFGFRKTLVRAHTFLYMRGLAESPSPGVVVGHAGWLFCATENSVASFRGIHPYSAAELATVVARLRARRDWLASQGIEFYVMLAPDKHSIYPEYMPKKLTRIGQRTRLNQLVPALRSAQIQVVDPRAALWQAKRQEQVYAKTDTHWNGKGGRAASIPLIEMVRKRFPAVPPVTASQFGWRKIRQQGDLMLLLGLDTREEIEQCQLPNGVTSGQDERHRTTTETNVPARPRLLLLGDSFAVALLTALAPSFQRILFVPSSEFDQGLIQHERPDLVIQEVVERYLSNMAVP